MNKTIQEVNFNELAEKLIKENNIKTNQVVNKESIAKVLEYVGGGSNDPDYSKDVEIIGKVLSDTKFSVKYLDTDYYFPEDKEVRAIYRITVKRNNKTISFKFGASIQMTYNDEKPDLYDILTCIQSDYHTGYEGYKEYCANFEVSEDSIKGLKLWKKIEAQFKKLDSIFDELEIWSFPN